jgi:hypothetical protein
MVVSFAGMLKDQVVTYQGTHTEPAERWHDTFHDFSSPTRNKVSLDFSQMPQTVEASQDIFADVKEDLEKYPSEVRTVMAGLMFRSAIVRQETASKVAPDIPGISHAFPVLVDLALRESTEGEFVQTLRRLGPPARSYAEQRSLAADASANFQRLLSRLGSGLKSSYSMDRAIALRAGSSRQSLTR